MPLYTFHCPKCDQDFEAFLRFSEAQAGAPCPSCGATAREPAGGAPAGPPPEACDLSKRS
jgi:putative FmdB family regulatory protein